MQMGLEVGALCNQLWPEFGGRMLENEAQSVGLRVQCGTLCCSIVHSDLLADCRLGLRWNTL